MTSYKRSGILSFALIGAAAFASGASGQSTAEWARVIAAAEKEGRVSFYTSHTPQQVETLSAAFQKAYPRITLEVVRNAEGTILPKIMQEQQMGVPGADAVTATPRDFFDDQTKAGQLVPMRGPNFAAFPKSSVYAGIAPIIGAMPLGMAYNTRLVQTPPQTYADLLKPEFKGAVGTISANASTAVTAWYDYLRTLNPGYWEKFAEQKPKLYPSSVPMTQSVASGEIKATLFTQPASVNALIATGATLKFVVPDSPEVWGIHYMNAILKNARNPNAAQVLSDFLVGRDGQVALNTGGLGMSALSGIPGALPSSKMIVFDPKNYSPEKLKAINEQWERTFRP